MRESDTLRAGSAGPGRSEDAMSGKSGKGAAKAVPRTHGRLTGYERDTVQRMLKRRARSTTSSIGSRACRPAGPTAT